MKEDGIYKATGNYPELLAGIERRLAEPGLEPHVRLSLEVMLIVGRVYYPWLEEQVTLAEEDVTRAAMVMYASCTMVANMYGTTSTHFMRADAGGFDMLMERFARNLAGLLGMKLDYGRDGDDGEPVAIPDRAKVN